jgi:hypothetical protein
VFSRFGFIPAAYSLQSLYPPRVIVGHFVHKLGTSRGADEIDGAQVFENQRYDLC